jgi:hypothetical protein
MRAQSTSELVQETEAQSTTFIGIGFEKAKRAGAVIVTGHRFKIEVNPTAISAPT